MKKGNVISIVLYCIIILVTALGFFMVQKNQVAPTKVYVWTVDSKETKIITMADVTEKTIPADAVTEDMILVGATGKDKNGKVVSALEAYVIGKAVDTAVYAGEYVTANALIDPADIDVFKTMDLSGYRKYALGTSALQCIGGNVEAGKVVDLMITVRGSIKKEDGTSENYTYTKIFMENVLIYKILTGNGEEYKDFIEHEEAEFSQPTTIILALTPSQIEEIKSRESIGQISFIGRFDDSVDADSEGYTIIMGDDGIEFIPDHSYEIQY